MSVAVVTDSAAMIPEDLVRARDIIVAPLTVTIDGRDYLDGVELTADELYRQLPGLL